MVVCSPDKDLAQLVSGSRVVCWDRRREVVYDEEAVIEKYGVPPATSSSTARSANLRKASFQRSPNFARKAKLAKCGTG